MRLRIPRTFDGLLPYLAPIGFILIFLFFFPPIYATSDEANIFGMTYVIRDMSVFPDRESGVSLHTVQRDGKRVSKYPLGMPVLLLPFSFAGWAALFVLPLTAHIIAYIFFLKLLAVARVDRKQALFFLFYPAFVLYSRTLLSNTVSMALSVAAFYCYVRRLRSTDVACGVLAGLAMWVRLDSVLIAGLMFLFMLLDVQQGPIVFRPGRAVRFLAGALAPMAGLLVYNGLVYGSPLATGYGLEASAGSEPMFALRYFAQNLPFYVVLLNIVYPLMLVCVLLYRGSWQLELKGLVLVYLLFFSGYYWLDLGGNVLETLVMGSRLLMPALPLAVLAYVGTLDMLLRTNALRRLTSVIWTAAAVGLTAGALMISSKHQGYLMRQKRFSNLIYENTTRGSRIIGDADVVEMLQPVWGQRYVTDVEEDSTAAVVMRSDNRNGIFVVILAKGEEPKAGTAASAFLSRMSGDYMVTATRRFEHQGWRMKILELGRIDRRGSGHQ